jgi:ankyrin repeat protein
MSTALDRSRVPQRVSEDDTVDSGDRGQVVPVPMSADEARDASSKFCDAILNGHINKIRFLVRQYSATDLTRICTVTDTEGWSVMTLAADSGNDDILTLLIKAHAPVDWPDANGWMPLHCAVHRGHETTVRCLISAPRMNVDYKSKHGWSALHIAVRKVL